MNSTVQGSAVKDIVRTPKGFNLRAQGRASAPWGTKADALTLKGFHHGDPPRLMKPFQGSGGSQFPNPGCAPSRPWALRCNPCGVKAARSEEMTCEVRGFCHRVTLTLPSPVKGEGESTSPSPLAGADVPFRRRAPLGEGESTSPSPLAGADVPFRRRAPLGEGESTPPSPLAGEGRVRGFIPNHQSTFHSFRTHLAANRATTKRALPASINKTLGCSEVL
jgi:hypothetical protein